MISSEARLEMADLRSSQEREAMVASVQARITREGRDKCIECGAAIPADRRAVAPFALRCVECQTLRETERYHR